MKKGRLAIITEHASTANFLYQDLQNLFGDHIDIQKYNFEENNVKQGIAPDLVLIAHGPSFKKVKKLVKDGTEIIVINRTITKKGLSKLMDLDLDTKAMVVNASMNTAISTVSIIHKLGVRQIELTPVYPGIDNIPDLDIAITPQEAQFVPENVKRIIDIGNRVLDISTIMDIIVKFKLNKLLDKKEVRDYFDKIAPTSFGLEKLMGKANRLESELDIVLNLLDVGIIGVNSTGIINSVNENAARILGVTKEKMLGGAAPKLISEIPFEEVLNKKHSINEKLIKINGWDIVLSIYPIINYNTTCGAVAIVKKFSDTELKQQKLRSQLINQGHVAKYMFDDIVGQSEKVKKCIKIAKRMAQSKSTILIMGESGTGKELFAQAIHNHSHRKNYQFVAVNCAALPENLLESELFGYEKGAFTGANKDGKLGLFELAHKGTLFLDEISEIPLKLQTRLLRVLEERQVMRIGGQRVIDVDVRIIAASNKNLKKLVDQGEFREDLYYRLSVLPLKIPSLKERKKDLLLLIEKLREEYNAQFKLSQEVIDVFKNHEWQGNVRELRNYIEYFSHLGKSYIEVSDFPFTLEDQKNNEEIYLNDKEKKELQKFKEYINKSIGKYHFILKELKRRNDNKENAGRRSIAQAAGESNYYLSEQEIRTMFNDLERFNMVTISRGRKGTQITKFGEKIINCL